MKTCKYWNGDHCTDSVGEVDFLRAFDKMLEALKLAAAQDHHIACRVSRGGYRCDCFVGKARDTIAEAQAVKRGQQDESADNIPISLNEPGFRPAKPGEDAPACEDLVMQAQEQQDQDQEDLT